MGRVSLKERELRKASEKLYPGQVITVGAKPKFAEEKFKIFYEDDQIVVIDKPEGLLSVSTLQETRHTAHAVLKRHAEQLVYPVQRLDRDTSGVMVFAYTQEARHHLKNQLEVHSVEREYRALIEGIMNPTRGTLKSYLVEDGNFFVHTDKSETGKLAITHYEMLERRGKFSLLKLKLETGRKNQIRVQLSEAGFPIVGDRKYGPEFKKSKRLHLHAYKLGFQHPTLNKWMEFTSPTPF